MPFRHQGGRDGVKKTPARHPSQCSDPEFRCSVGDVSSTIASSALPPGRLIVRVLSSGCEASRATRRHAERSHRAHHSHAGRNNFEKQRSASIWSMQRRVWPNADANRALRAAIRRIGGKGRYGDLEIRALKARHCVRRLTPATLGVHLRDLFAMNRNKQRSEY